MTTTQLTELKQAESKATPAPWKPLGNPQEVEPEDEDLICLLRNHAPALIAAAETATSLLAIILRNHDKDCPCGWVNRDPDSKCTCWVQRELDKLNDQAP